ncbi:tRNA lysidine(34) synthetase TilS [Roseateles sp. DB2]|uniref:tRNA lysidine(34) synthetase TilS n=1 Tax=Roseateles sp. DB2 TaxID=3453717 RepID=UPI003EECD87B
MAVAWSGGRDSTALMHATARCAQSLAHEGFALRVLGLHVHHGLSPRADDWLAQLQHQTQVWLAQGLPVALRWQHLSGSPGPGDSVEAWAREGRHVALQAMAEEAGASLLLLAHHRRDQAETWLLQALRGAGLAGLSAMPQQQARGGLVWARPWLDQPRGRIERYVQALGLDHVEDESNADPRFSRNRLRLKLWPVLEAGFPEGEAALAQSARWAQEAGELLDEIARQDLRAWMTAPSGLDLKAWTLLSRPRLSNLLRHWLRARLGRPAPASLVSRLLDEVGAAVPGAAWPAGGLVIQKHKGSLLALPVPLPAPTPPVACRMDLSQPGLHDCPQWCGRFRVDVVQEPSSELVGSSLLRNVILRPREGSEQFQRAPGTPPRSLKKSWQAAGVPAQGRSGPLVFVDSPGESGLPARLLWVPALGLDARCRGQGEGPLMRLTWLPDAA